ncbi:MAG: deoxyguanosinetriphosphate triphosphohydrolase [Maricaulaceae bacterium]
MIIPQLGSVARPRAPYASDPDQSRGRRIDELPSATRTPFQRDRDRIIHASAFRRLKQKTQVFVAHEGDHYRTRLTHSLEVAQIARSVARALGVDEDLAEAIALAHDLGHPPFGHAGESALAQCMAPYGGFDHNAQTLRVLTRLEARYPEFDGLNLCWETLEGVVKHNGPLTAAPDDDVDLPWAITDYTGWRELEVHTFAGLEAQIAALSDDIAYNNHDIDDGLRAGYFTIDDLRDLPRVGVVFDAVEHRYGHIEESRRIHEAVRRLIGLWISDLLAETRERLERYAPRSAQEVREADGPLVGFSAEMRACDASLRRFLMERMYRHHRLNRKMSRARRVITELFELFIAEPDLLPGHWRPQGEDLDSVALARRVCDYVAGMTDGYAIEEHRRLFSVERLV